MSARTALLINCSKDEATTMRRRAEIERRTVSGHVLNVVMKVVQIDEALGTQFANAGPLKRTVWRRETRPAGPRTTVLLRCSGEESRRIRAGAQRKDMTISGFVLNCLQRAWKARLAAERMAQARLPWDSD